MRQKQTERLKITNCHHYREGLSMMDLKTETTYQENSTVMRNSTDGYTLFHQYPPQLLTLGAVCCIFFAVVGVFGNVASILALAKCARLRNATTAFVINLCIADLVFCAFSLPLSAVTFMERGWNYGDDLCKVFPLIRYCNGALSLFSVIAITINRYILIVHPSKYSSTYRFRNVAVMIVVLWFLSILLLLPPLLEVWGRFGFDPKVGTCSILRLNGKSPKTFIHILALLIPSLIFVFCYSRIYWVVRNASRNLRKSQLPQGSMPQREKSLTAVASPAPRDKNELGVLRVMLVVFVTYCLCYFPVSFIKIFNKEKDLHVLNVVGYMLVYFSNCVNPIIYVAMSNVYRQAYIQLFTCKNAYSVK